MKPELFAIAKIHWIEPAKGGRKNPPLGNIYAATARFEDQSHELFSIVLHFNSSANSHITQENNNRDINKAKISFLAPKIVASKLVKGVKLLITEGPKIVAECEILEVNNAGGEYAETAAAIG